MQEPSPRLPIPRLCRGSLPGLLAGLCFLVGGGYLPAEESNDTTRLTLERIFTSGELGGESFGAYQWRKSKSGFTKLERSTGDVSGQDLVWQDARTGDKEILVPAHHFIPPGESGPLAIESYQFSEDESKLLLYNNSKRVWRTRSRGDYWCLDIAAHTLKKLGGDAPPSSLMFATFSPDGRRVCYVRANNLYVQDLNDLEITALTGDGSETRINGTFDWVYEEELRLRRGFRWSPDSQAIAYWQVDTEAVPRFQIINYTDGLYPELLSFPYPKVGQQNPAVRVGVVPVRGGETVWLGVPGEPRDHYIACLEWAENAEELVLQQFNRLQNTNRVFLANARTGRAEEVLTETDAAWVENENKIWWMEGGKEFVWLSERDGWKHAYRVDLSDKKISRITKGEFDVIRILAVEESGGHLYFIASPDNPTQRYLYRVPLKGGKSKRLTPDGQAGTHTYSLSPDAQWAVHTYSTFTNPPVTDLVRLPDHESVRPLAENKKLIKKLAALDQPVSEFFRVDIGEGIALDGWCIQPPDLDPARKYPVLFLVYGEPAGQTVLDRWGGRSSLWYWMLAQEGYLIMSLDNRGTPAPRGRAWRKSIYRQVGVLASADQAAGARALLRERPYVDEERVAIWGWSGGGSMTLNAMFRYPDLYQTGLSVAPVPNQRYYDTIYQERYMGLPGDNAEGYRNGSPITFAHQLKGHLLLVHGTGDDNCHYQGTEALINELIVHNKPFTMMAYPNRSHGISEGPNTTRHLYELLTRYLREHTPPGPRNR